jgi:hypothetical protein
MGCGRVDAWRAREAAEARTRARLAGERRTAGSSALSPHSRSDRPALVTLETLTVSDSSPVPDPNPGYRRPDIRGGFRSCATHETSNKCARGSFSRVDFNVSRPSKRYALGVGSHKIAGAQVQDVIEGTCCE